MPDPKFICPRPPAIPDCQVVGVDRGIIEDMELSDKGLIKKIAISGQDLLAYNWDSKQIPLDIGGIEFSKSTEPGSFAGCPACSAVLKEGGTIKGIVQEKGQVLAIISEFSVPSGSALKPVNKSIQTVGTLPYLQLVGTIPVTGQPLAAAGDTVTVYGAGFCGSPTCSAITVRVGSRVVAENIKPDDKGTFRVSFPVREMPGQYLVTASQLSATKTAIEDRRLLIVPMMDKERQ